MGKKDASKKVDKKPAKSAKKSVAERSVEGAPRAGAGKAVEGSKPRRKRRLGSAMDVERPQCDRCGEAHTKCSGHTKHGPNTGKPCGANPPLGQLSCVKHGGNHPAHKEKARERMQEMVMPFLAELRRVVLDPSTDDSVKVRGIQVLLDRTGYGPGATVTVQGSAWDDLIGELATGHVELDRSLDGSREYDALPGGVGAEDVEQAVYDAQSIIDRARHDAEGREYDRGRIRPDANTIRGEVVEESGLFPPPLGPRAMQDMGGEAYPRRGDSTDREPDDPPAYGSP